MNIAKAFYEPLFDSLGGDPILLDVCGMYVLIQVYEFQNKLCTVDNIFIAVKVLTHINVTSPRLNKLLFNKIYFNCMFIVSIKYRI